MNAFFLLIPFLIIRFFLMGRFAKNALQRAAHFAPLVGFEKTAYLLYQLTTLLLIFYPLFLSVTITNDWLFIVGTALYLLSNLLCLLASYAFAKPSANGLNTAGFYRFSRNPMYVAYFLFFLSIVLLTRSLPLLIILVLFQLAAHWIIRAEERWCFEQFGQSYQEYQSQVRRYF
ncbi:methyltransferase family protein [Enterococcus sp. LJL90]